jgi:hypothetical protein
MTRSARRRRDASRAATRRARRNDDEKFKPPEVRLFQHLFEYRYRF